MVLNDLLSVFTWWLVLFAIGNFFLPVTSYLFSFFYDKGYAFSKIIGIIVLSYTAWLLGSLKLVPFTTPSLFGLLIVFIALNGYLAYKKHSLSVTLFNRKIFFIEEGLFLIGLLFWSYVRAHEPSIHGLEKFMDFGFVNSILRSQYFPPKDIWMTPLTINYYYFGHLVTAVLTKLSFLDPAISFNLMIATLFALTLSTTFALGGNLYHFFALGAEKISLKSFRAYLILTGALTAFLVTLGGNLHTIYVFFQTYTPPDHPVPFWQLPLQFNPQGYWYPNATRFIPFTIHEFPIYSFVVSDLHGHVLDIPIVLLTIAWIVKIFFQKQTPWFDYIAVGFLISILLMTNVLDGPIYLLVFGLMLFTKNLIKDSFWHSTKSIILPLIAIFFSFVLFSLPFWLSFNPFSSGIGVMCMPQFLINLKHLGPFLFEADHCSPSPIWMLMILWGFFYFVTFGFICYIANKQKIIEMNKMDFLILVFILSATIFILIPELFYVKDIYPTYYRANTVFKFGYQAFILLGLSSGYMLIRLLMLKPRPIKFLIPTFLLFFLVAIYPYFAINSYYGDLKIYQGLNGLNYLDGLYPEDYQAIMWLRANIKGQPVILEAQGDSYTDYARISANTGLPTVIGWPVHEWLWRGSYDEAGKRSAEVQTLYQTKDVNETKKLLDQFNVSYVYIGQLERDKYPDLDQSKFAKLGTLVYQTGNTFIYQIR